LPFTALENVHKHPRCGVYAAHRMSSDMYGPSRARYLIMSGYCDTNEVTRH